MVAKQDMDKEFQSESVRGKKVDDFRSFDISFELSEIILDDKA